MWDMKTGEQLHMTHTPPIKGAERMELLQRGAHIVCESYVERTPLFVINRHSLKVEHSGSKRKTDFIHHTLLTTNCVLREGQVIDLKTGKTKKSLKQLTEARNDVTVAVSSDTRYCFIGGETAIQMIDVEAQEEVGHLPGSTVPSQLVLTGDDCILVAGYTADCSVVAFNVNRHSDKFGAEIKEFSYQESFPTAVFKKGEQNRQEVTELSLSARGDKVLANVKDCHLFVVPLSPRPPVNLDVTFNEDTQHIRHCAFTHDDRLVVATAGATLCSWLVNSGETAWSVRLSGLDTDEHRVLPSPATATLATVSKMDTVIRVWDMSKLQDDSIHRPHLFSNPVDLVVVDEIRKLAFVKTYHRLKSQSGCHYVDHFGVDLWNLSTNTHRCLLPRAHYGRLKKMMTAGGRMRLCLWTEGTTLHHIYIVDVDTGDIITDITEHGCKDVQLSENGHYMLTETSGRHPFHNTVRLWNADTLSVLQTVDMARSPIVDLNSQYFIYCCKNKLIVFDIKTEQTHKSSVSPGVIKLQTVPAKRDTVLATLLHNPLTKQCVVIAYNFLHRKQVLKMSHVAAGGFADISKNGTCAVDGSLQVFDLNTGHLMVKCAAETSGLKPLVRLTHPGCHVIWADQQPTDSLHVYKLSMRKSVATVNTHSKVLSLHTADYGFTVVAGCEDGNLLTFKLHQTETTSNQSEHGNAGQVDNHASQSDHLAPVDIVIGDSQSEGSITHLSQVSNKTGESEDSNPQVGQIGLCLSHSESGISDASEKPDAVRLKSSLLSNGMQPRSLLSVPTTNHNADGWSLGGGATMYLSPHIVASLDPLYRAEPTSLQDRSLPTAWPIGTRQQLQLAKTENLIAGNQDNSCLCHIL